MLRSMLEDEQRRSRGRLERPSEAVRGARIARAAAATAHDRRAERVTPLAPALPPPRFSTTSMRREAERLAQAHREAEARLAEQMAAQREELESDLATALRAADERQAEKRKASEERRALVESIQALEARLAETEVQRRRPTPRNNARAA